MDISLNIPQKHFKYFMCVLHNHIVGTVSQISNIGFCFCFMES